jgi:hypothetical protein
MKRFHRSPVSASIFCSSLEVPSVVTTAACVSPRWKSADPWTRGRMPTSHTIGRIVFMSRPSMRLLLGEHVVADDVVLALLELGLDELLELGERSAPISAVSVSLELVLRPCSRRSAPSCP